MYGKQEIHEYEVTIVRASVSFRENTHCLVSGVSPVKEPDSELLLPDPILPVSLETRPWGAVY